MSWIIASFPLWIFGGLALVCGLYGLYKTATNESSVPAFKGGSDGDATMVCLGMVLISAPPLCLAAWLIS